MRSFVIVPVLALGILSLPPRAAGQTCNTAPPPCGGAPACKGSCGAAVAIHHAAASTCGAPFPVGGFDFRGTQYEHTCLLGSGGCTVAVPPLRFWQYQRYGRANSGCMDPVVNETMAHTALDFGIGSVPGYWFLYKADWAAGPSGDGCISALYGELRTVVEFSFPEQAFEGTVDHRARYLVASVPVTLDYNFDDLRGGSGCSTATIAAAPVPSLLITGSSGPCVGGTAPTIGTDNVADPLGYFDIDVSLANPSPDYHDEVGKSTPAKPLIAGYQVLYAGGTSADPSSEPRSSAADAGGWLPARNPANPAEQAAVIPYGTAQAAVSIPRAACGSAPCWYWLATRIVYRDDSQNPLGPVAPGRGPWVVSAVSDHCGPVSAVSPIPPTVFRRSPPTWLPTPSSGSLRQR